MPPPALGGPVVAPPPWKPKGSAAARRPTLKRKGAPAAPAAAEAAPAAPTRRARQKGPQSRRQPGLPRAAPPQVPIHEPAPATPPRAAPRAAPERAPRSPRSPPAPETPPRPSRRLQSLGSTAKWAAEAAEKAAELAEGAAAPLASPRKAARRDVATQTGPVKSPVPRRRRKARAVVRHCFMMLCAERMPDILACGLRASRSRKQ